MEFVYGAERSGGSGIVQRGPKVRYLPTSPLLLQPAAYLSLAPRLAWSMEHTGTRRLLPDRRAAPARQRLDQTQPKRRTAMPPCNHGICFLPPT